MRVVVAHRALRDHVLDAEARGVEAFGAEREQVRERPRVLRDLALVRRPRVEAREDAPGFLVAPRVAVLLRPLLRLRLGELLLSRDQTTQRARLFVHLVEVALPARAAAFERREEGLRGGAAQGGGQVFALELKQEDVQEVEVAVAQVDGGALVAVEVDDGRRVGSALALEVVGVFGRRVDEGDERVDALQRVVAQQPPLGDDVVAAARGAAEHLDEVVALTVDALVGVGAVVGDEDERRLRRPRASSGSRPRRDRRARRSRAGGRGARRGRGCGAWRGRSRWCRSRGSAPSGLAASPTARAPSAR